MTAWDYWYDRQEAELLAAGARGLLLEDLPLLPREAVDPLAVRRGYPSSALAEASGLAGARLRQLDRETR